MSTPEPYEVLYEPHVETTVARFPAGARRALDLKRIAAEPELGVPLTPGGLRSSRTAAFGSAGLAVYVLSHRLRRIMVEHVIWTG